MPTTKKNHSIVTKSGRVVPSKAYQKYLALCGGQLDAYKNLNIDFKCNICCQYYLPTNKDGSIPKRRTDLCNLLGATCDILTFYNVISDDNCCIVYSHDGSCVNYIADEPYVEIWIEEL